MPERNLREEIKLQEKKLLEESVKRENAERAEQAQQAVARQLLFEETVRNIGVLARSVSETTHVAVSASSSDRLFRRGEIFKVEPPLNSTKQRRDGYYLAMAYKLLENDPKRYVVVVDHSRDFEVAPNWFRRHHYLSTDGLILDSVYEVDRLSEDLSYEYNPRLTKAVSQALVSRGINRLAFGVTELQKSYYFDVIARVVEDALQSEPVSTDYIDGPGDG